MRKSILTLAALFVFSSGAVAEDLNNEYLQAIGDYHQASQQQVVTLANQLGVNEATVALTIAKKSGIAVDKVAQLRKLGQSWSEVARSCKLTTVDFYIMISGKFESKTFSPIFEKFNTTATNAWSSVVLSDHELVNLANLRLMASQHDYSMFDIMAMKDIGSDWPRINQKVLASKEDLKQKFSKR